MVVTTFGSERIRSSPVRRARRGRGFGLAVTPGAYGRGGPPRPTGRRALPSTVPGRRQRYSRPSSTSAAGSATRSCSYSYMCFHGSRSPWRNIRSCERMT